MAMNERDVAEAISKNSEHLIAEFEELLKAQNQPASDKEVEKMRAELSAIARDLRDHIEREEAMISAGFPNGDLPAHRASHEQMIEAAREEAKFWRELRLDLAKKGIWGLAVILVGLALVGITFKLGLAK